MLQVRVIRWASEAQPIEQFVRQDVVSCSCSVSSHDDHGRNIANGEGTPTMLIKYSPPAILANCRGDTPAIHGVT